MASLVLNSLTRAVRSTAPDWRRLEPIALISLMRELAPDSAGFFDGCSCDTSTPLTQGELGGFKCLPMKCAVCSQIELVTFELHALVSKVNRYTAVWTRIVHVCGAR